jgi:hypothetical protein
LPLAAGTAALIAIDSGWIVPLYWFCAGVSSGLGTVQHTTSVTLLLGATVLGLSVVMRASRRIARASV